MADLRPDLSGIAAAVPPVSPSGPLMSLQEFAATARASRRPAGATVSVMARPVDMTLGRADHMFVEYDDGHAPLIARGQPSRSGLGLVLGSLDGTNRVAAQVDPAERSPDYGTKARMMAQTFLPGVTAEQAAAGAVKHAEGVNRGGNAYGWNGNSNSFAADVAEPILGRRPGDARTPGSQTHLNDQGSVPGNAFSGPLWAADLPPVIRTPPY